MKTAGILTLKLTGLAVVFLYWRLTSHHTFRFFWSLALMWGTVALVPLLAAFGRSLLDRRPTPKRATHLTIPVHYLEMILLGCALIIAFRFTQVHPIARIPFPRAISFPLLQFLGVLATLSVLNLAIRGARLALRRSSYQEARHYRTQKWSRIEAQVVSPY